VAFDPVFSSLWLYGATGDTTVEPLDQCWNWNEVDLAVTEVAVAGVDEDNIDRLTELATVMIGDRIHVRNTTTANNWALFDVADIEDLTTWFRFTVALVGTGTVAGLPVFRQRVLFDFVRPVVADRLTVADVERKLGVAVGSLDADEVLASIHTVQDWSARHLKLEHLASPTTELVQNQAKAAADDYRWKNSPNGWSGSDEMVPVPVRAYDPRITRHLSGYMRTAGLFGPSANTDEA
jgi:hypothetical protein